MRQPEKSLKILLFLPIIYFAGVFKSPGRANKIELFRLTASDDAQPM
jgi:hypothetical protein